MNAVRHYGIHGHSLRLNAASELWADAVHEILGSYECGPVDEPTLNAYLGGPDRALSIPDNLRERGRFEDLVFYRDPASGQIWIRVHERGWVQVDSGLGSLHASLDYDPRDDDWFVAHHAFYPAFLELLKFRGLFPAHSGLVSQGMDGMLICGASGSGKTTLCLELATHGWEFLADDTCFLRQSGTAVEGLSFWEDLHVTEETMARFESLSFLRDQEPRRKNWKRHFAIGELSALRPREQCRPRWLIFPRVLSGKRSGLTKISPSDAFLRLMPQSVIPADPNVVERHLELMGILLAQVESYELAMGEELGEVRDCLESGISRSVA